MSKLTLKGLKDLLKNHSLDEADKMANIRPDLLATLRSALSQQNTSSTQALTSQHSTSKFN